MFKSVFVRVLVAAALCLLIVFLIDNNFNKYVGSVTLSGQQGVHKFYGDINQDGTTESVQVGNLSENHIYSEIWRNDKILRVEHIYFNMIRQAIIYGDYNLDGNYESYLFSQNDTNLFLNILTYHAEDPDLIPSIEEVSLLKFKDTINQIHIHKAEMVDLDQDGYLDLLFVIDKGEPHRQVCKYDFVRKKLTISPTMHMLVTQMTAINLDEDKELEIVFSSYANGNTPPDLMDQKNQLYQIEQDNYYTDENCYWGIFDHNLSPDIQQVKEGFTSQIRHILFKENNEFRLFTMESNLVDSMDVPMFKTFNLQGDMLAEQPCPLPIKSEDLGKNGKLHLKTNGDSLHPRLYVDAIGDSIIELNSQLEIVAYHHYREFNGKTTVNFYDLNADGKQELICNVDGGFMIFQENFTEPLFLSFEHSGELTNSPTAYFINGEQTGNIFKSRGSYFLIAYGENAAYFWKYIYYLGIFLGFYMLVYLLQRFQTAQLEKENRKLEVTVKERTAELADKNTTLSMTLEEVEIQKSIVEAKSREILDSISYAKRIQTAILPPRKLVKAYLNNSFVLYKPKDIVAGDFYWMEPLEETIYFAAADCTGHGVPGAMVSVLCNGALNRAVREFKLLDPAQILDKTRELVMQEFEKSEEELKDGMDIALVALSQGDKSSLKFAGAHNPLWIIRNGAREIEIIRADKQPIGMYAAPKSFTSHDVDLNPGDTIYVFSDGYVDQFGGEKGKKFKAKALRNLLLSIQDKTMEEQSVILDTTFEKWRGTLEQVDDVCIIGVRV